jgi:hypothetical protein
MYMLRVNDDASGRLVRHLLASFLKGTTSGFVAIPHRPYFM